MMGVATPCVCACLKIKETYLSDRETVVTRITVWANRWQSPDAHNNSIAGARGTHIGHRD
jgi:hypothetical protein